MTKESAKRQLLQRLRQNQPQPRWLFAVPETEAGRSLAPNFRPYPLPKNTKRTEHVFLSLDRLMQSHRDPREILLEMAETHVADVAALLDCTLLEAWQEKRLAAVAVLPYVARKRPVEIDVSTRAQVELTIITGDPPVIDGVANEVEVVENRGINGGIAGDGDGERIENAAETE